MPMPVPVSHHAGEFSWLCRSLMVPQLTGAAPPRVQNMIATKTAIGAGTEPVDYLPLFGEFSESLRTRSVFFRLMADSAMMKVPLRCRLGIQTGTMTGATVGEGASIPINKVALKTDLVLVPMKCGIAMVVTSELARDVSAAGQASFSRELQNATGAAVDSAFLSAVMESGGGSVITSAGATAANALTDMRAALSYVTAHSNARYYWIASPAVAMKLATLGSAGLVAHPAASPQGGELLGLPLLVSEAVANNALLLIDASQIVAALDAIDVSGTSQADVVMDTAPGMSSATPTASTLVNLWQTNSVGLKVIVSFAALRLRANTTATIASIAWS